MNTKLQADYAELVHQYLDNLPAEKEQDFEVIVEALKSITEPTVSHTVPQNLEGRIKTIKEIVDNPDLYVQDNKYYDEFKTIIIQRVVAKINEIQNLSPADKEKYIADQKKLKETAMASQSVIKTHQPPAPGSEAHTISEQQMLQQMQLQFQQELLQTAQAPLIPSEADRLRNRLNHLPSLAELEQRLAALNARIRDMINNSVVLTPWQMLEIQIETSELTSLQTRRQNLEAQLRAINL